jgi:hypothetical protein
VICSSWLLHSPNGKHDKDKHSRAENDSRDPGYLDWGSPSWVKCHAPFLAAVGRQRIDMITP